MNIGDILTAENYTQGAIWCNSNNGHIEKQNGKYVIVANPTPEPQPIVPSEIDKIEAQVMYTALLTDTLLPEVE